MIWEIHVMGSVILVIQLLLRNIGHFSSRGPKWIQFINDSYSTQLSFWSGLRKGERLYTVLNIRWEPSTKTASHVPWSEVLEWSIEIALLWVETKKHTLLTLCNEDRLRPENIGQHQSGHVQSIYIHCFMFKLLDIGRKWSIGRLFRPGICQTVLKTLGVKPDTQSALQRNLEAKYQKQTRSNVLFVLLDLHVYHPNHCRWGVASLPQPG